MLDRLPGRLLASRQRVRARNVIYAAAMSQSRAKPSVEALDRTTWRAVVTPEADFDSMAAGFRDLASIATEAGDAEAASSCEVLSAICSLRPALEPTRDPYAPMWELEDRRSFLPEDLSPADLEYIEDLVPLSDNGWLAARLADLLWIRKHGLKPYEAARTAVRKWFSAGLRTEHWMDALENWPRFIQLAKQLKFVPELQEARDALAARFWDPATEPRRVLDFADLLTETGLPDRAEWERIADRLSQLAAEEQDGLLQRHLYAEVARMRRRLGDEDNYATAQYEVVAWWVREAERRSADSAGASVSLYQSALKELRLIPNKQRVRLKIDGLATELAGRIRAAGVSALDEMIAFTSPGIDIQDDAERVQALVSGHDAAYATALFVGIAPYVAETQTRTDAERLLAESVMDRLFVTQHYAPDGRVTGASLPDSDGPWEGYPANVWEKMLTLFDLHVQAVVKVLILPALEVMTVEHRIRVRDLRILSECSPIVPADRRESVSRALAAGFSRDWITALYLLVPQVENIVRSLLVSAGVLTTQMKEDASEHELGLSALLERTELIDILGADILFELRALFGGPVGANLRNNVAHGLLSDGEAGSLHAIYAWWFLLRLVYIPYWNGLQSERAKADESQQDESD